jgi:methionyl-tRNA formyltransferase
MKIIYFGTPDFAVYPLQKLIDNNYNISAVVTVQDKPKGRGLQLQQSPVKKIALENNIKVLQPVQLKDENFINELRNLEPDLFIVVAFKILPKEVYSIPKFGSFNLHGSLLPKYRGAAPIQWALINGDSETGLTTFFLDDKVDTGNIIKQVKLDIYPDDNFATLYYRMAKIGADLVIDTVETIKSGNFELIKQDERVVSYAPKITKEICQINWNKTAMEIHNLIRGLSPTPGAFFVYNNALFKILASQLTNIPSDYNKKFLFNKEKFYIACKDFYIEILKIKPENSKEMTAGEFIRGYAKKFT